MHNTCVTLITRLSPTKKLSLNTRLHGKNASSWCSNEVRMLRSCKTACKRITDAFGQVKPLSESLWLFPQTFLQRMQNVWEYVDAQLNDYMNHRPGILALQ